MPNPMIDVEDMLNDALESQAGERPFELDDEAALEAASHVINERRAQVEDAEGLRKARAL